MYEFWIVWNPNGNNTEYRYHDQADAEQEARRLASLHRGQEFFVAHVTDLFTAEDVIHKKLGVDPIPF